MKFYIDPKQQEKYDKWMQSKDLNSYTGAIGGRFTYLMTPTSLGTIYKIRDNLDKTELDVTEYDW
jgi:hypothetical protein